jgi:nicotinate-nucleotide adenylyltransferase
MKKTGTHKIVIYGGMFDPPHRGHFALIKAALRELRPAALYVVPGFRSPFKTPPCASFRDRAAMLKDGLRSAGLGGDARVRIHPYEAERGRLTYTWRTVAFFRKKHPGAELYLLLGSDCLETFHLWKKYRHVAAAARLLVGIRRGSPPGNPRGLPYARLRGRFPAISSTALKTGLFAGVRRPGLLNGTAAYVAARGLYLAGLRRALARRMTPERFRHTVGTARLALELALKYGADPLKTALAALLHDAARDLSPRALAAYAVSARLKMPALKAALKNAPVTIHPYAGADMAGKIFGVTDREVVKAVRVHAFGCASPGLLDKIVFVADLAEAGRNFPEARGIRKLAFKDLDAAYAAAHYVKLGHAFRAGRWIHPESIKTWNSLLEKNR